MNGYSWVSVISIFCYLFLLVAFISAKKPKNVIRTFIAMLAIMILWNGGSLGMRLQLWPSVNFWHHVSLLGMFMVTVGYFHFVLDFLDDRRNHGRTFWLFFYIGLFVFNCFTNFFIPLPEVVTEGGKTQFLYHYTDNIYLLFIPILITLTQLTAIIWRHCRGNRIAFQQLRPIITGLFIMLLGHTLATLPFFVGFPADMLSGAVNAFFLFYAMYKKKLFHMSILLSKYNCATIAVFVTLALFANFAAPLELFLIDQLGFGSVAAMAIIAICSVGLVVILYLVIRHLFNAIFARTEQQLQALVEQFHEEITHMLSVEDILPILSDTLQKAADFDRLLILTKEPDGEYHISHTIRQLEERSFVFRPDHPLVTHFKTHSEGLALRDFERTTAYRSMWEKEKSQLSNLHIEYIVPLKSDNELVGVIIMAGKQNKPAAHPGNIWFFQAIAESSAVAIRNASTYEQAIQEAQRDDLTGLTNYKFFFEVLDREFESIKDSALSLCLINIDDFKLYNQMYGSQEGDMILRHIARILTGSINGSCHAARINGDEFALILPGYDVYSAKLLAENIASQIEEVVNTISVDGPRKLSVSIGICSAPYMASSAKELYRNADMTVYNVKRSGKNAVQIYSSEMFPRKSAAPPHKSGYNENASTIYALSAAIDAKDHYTSQHSQNVAHYAAALAQAADMEDDIVEIVREAGLLHDIGKIGIREDILNKPGKLTADEYEAIKKHVENAVSIIRYLPSLDYVIPAVLSHHERFDGTGYPNGLAGDAIPITGRILSIADAFDAMTSIRNYKDAMSSKDALQVLHQEAGRQFDPELVRVFIELVESGKVELRCQTPQQTTIFGWH